MTQRERHHGDEELRAARREAEDARRRLAAVFHGAPLGWFAVDAAGRSRT